MDAKHVPALIGRARELGELDGALARLARGEPWFVQIVGEPGIGKSRLLGELCLRGEQRGYLVLEGQAAEFERDIPFGLIVDALNDYVGALEPAILRALDADAVQELASIFPSLPTPDGGSASGGRGAERYRLHYAIRSLLERLTKRQPVVLAFDDVHWADAASAEMLTHLLRRFSGPLVMAVAYRPSAERRLAALAATAQPGSSTRFELGALTAAQARHLIGPDVDDTARTVLYRESGGNPFYLEQLARSRAVEPTGIVVADRSPQSVPHAVIAAIHAELLAVSADARLTLEAGAVVGDSFEPELVAAIAERDVADVLPALDELLAVDFIRPTDVPRRFRFRHPIVRRAVYDEMPAGWRIGAHGRAAEMLAATHAPDAVRAHHVAISAPRGDERAIALLVQAGRDAAPRAPETAGRWLLSATRLLPRSEGDERRLSLLSEAASALMFAGAYEESLQVLDEAGTLLAPDRTDQRAALAARIAFAKRMSGRPFESRTLVERALAPLPPDSPAGLGLALELALDHYWRGEFAAMYVIANSVRVHARAHGEPLFLGWAAALCSLASSALSRWEDGRSELDEAESALRALPDERLAEQLDVAGYVAQAAATLEEIDGALEHIRRGLRLARLTGQSPFIPGLLVMETNALFMQGRITEAVAVAETATDAAELTGNDQLVVWALWADAMVCSCAGDTARALASARAATTRAEYVTETYFSSLSRLHFAAALHAASDVASARAELSAFEAGPGQRLLDLRGGLGWELLIRTQLALGDLSGAGDVAANAEARARATLVQRTASAVCARAAVLLAHDEIEPATEAALEAKTLAESTGNPYLEARAQTLVGTAFGRCGDIEQAVAELESAERTLFSCGALRDADAAAQELRRLGRRRPRRSREAARSVGPSALSPRELEVATLVAAGKRNRDVAAALFVSEKTVESHLARIYDKLGVRSRAALAAIMAAGDEAPAARTAPGPRPAAPVPRAGGHGEAGS
jgi:ATP/maltotriose-dependent transcriptional regulator MalT